MNYDPGQLTLIYGDPVLIIAGWSSKCQMGSFNDEVSDLEIDDETYVVMTQWNVRVMSWYWDMFT